MDSMGSNNGNGITLKEYFDKKQDRRVKQLLRWAEVVIADESKRLIKEELTKFRDYLGALAEALYTLSENQIEMIPADKRIGIYKDYLTIQEYLNTGKIIMQ